MWKWIAVSLFGVVANTASAQLPDLERLLGARPAPTSGVSDERAAAGLREALQVGTGKAVGLVGRTDGYFANEAIRIAMPEKLRMVEKGLRAAGYGPKVDAFVLSMNRAAERAAPAAKEIFISAIREMTFDDARRVLSGGDTAATDYFRDKTSDRLRTAFRPVVEKSMQESGVSQRYEAMIGSYRSIPFAGGVSLDLDGYVVERALDGLFYMVAQQEKEIRTNPAARVTDLLRSVFGSD
jgi:hypothetical protein